MQTRPTAAGFMSPAGSEAFRLLRSSLKWTQRDGAMKSLAITSALSEEGKTTTSANLAVVYALEGKRVLLVDCDLRRPRLHKVFHVPRSPGVAQILRTGLDPASAVRDTFFHGLSFLPAGRDTDAIADLIGSDRMRALLETLSEQFDMIVLDTPPVLAVADAVSLGPLVDGILMVVGAGSTDRHAVEQALHQLASGGARVVGAVLNDSRGEVERYGGTDYYAYQDDYARSPSTA
jgi:capsular exopolysaccharide synthesis family protein